MTMENGKSFVPPKLTKKPKSKWQAPWCNHCNDVVEGWLYHAFGHTDDTPLVILKCHNGSHTFGCTPEYAPAFREEMLSRFASGNERLELNSDGTYNGPTERSTTKPVVNTHDRKEREPNIRDI